MINKASPLFEQPRHGDNKLRFVQSRKLRSTAPAVRQSYLYVASASERRRFEPRNFLHRRAQVAHCANAPDGLRDACRGGRLARIRCGLSGLSFLLFAPTVHGICAPAAHALTIGFSALYYLRAKRFVPAICLIR
jgi:hypothetical protein